VQMKLYIGQKRMDEIGQFKHNKANNSLLKVLISKAKRKQLLSKIKIKKSNTKMDYANEIIIV